MRHACRTVLAAMLTCWIAATTHAAPATQTDTCLMFAANNIAKGGGNFFIYAQFSDKRIDLKPGDALEYDIFLNPANPVLGGGFRASEGSVAKIWFERKNFAPAETRPA